MRINVYAEELTKNVELVTKTVTDDTFGTRTFYGLRFYLASPDVLHFDPNDDDRSAITLWVPWTRAGGHDFGVIGELLASLGGVLRDARAQEGDERAHHGGLAEAMRVAGWSDDQIGAAMDAAGARSA